MLRSTLLPMIAILGVAAPAVAQPQSQAMYRAGLSTPDTSTLVVKDMRWACAGDSCSAIRTGSSPDANVCAAMVRRLGPVTSFSAGDKVFDAVALEKCNAAARS